MSDRRRITIRQWRDHLNSLSSGGEIRKAIHPRLRLAADPINKKAEIIHAIDTIQKYEGNTQL